MAAFGSQLETAGLNLYSRLLVPILISRLRRRSPEDLEAAGLLDEVRLGGYGEYSWEEALDCINPNTGERRKVENWLKGFYEVHSRGTVARERARLTSAAQ
jgi:hypothetical protein